MTRYLIIGNGAAGTEAAAAIRKIDADGSITIVTDSRFLHYWRPKLVHFIAEDLSPESLLVYDEAWYAERRIHNALGRKIVRLDTESRIATDAAGTAWPWDKLLVATGSLPVVPPIPGADRPGVFTLRSVTDAERIKRYSADVRDVLVIGGGLLGLENAYSLLRLGKNVTVAEFSKWLLPRQLDSEGGGHLRTLLEAKGMRFELGEQVAAIEGEGPGSPVSRVALKSGKDILAQAVIVSAGVRSDIEFVAGTGIKTNRGIVVDDSLETSIPLIWAAGDVAEHRGICYGLWTVAREQGRIAGMNMAGTKTPYSGSVPSTLLKITGIDVFSSGDVSLADKPGSGQSIGSSDSTGYRKILLDDSRKPVAAMVVGDKAAIPSARDIMSGKADPRTFRRG